MTATSPMLLVPSLPSFKLWAVLVMVSLWTSSRTSGLSAFRRELNWLLEIKTYPSSWSYIKFRFSTVSIWNLNWFKTPRPILPAVTVTVPVCRITLRHSLAGKSCFHHLDVFHLLNIPRSICNYPRWVIITYFNSFPEIQHMLECNFPIFS